MKKFNEWLEEKLLMEFDPNRDMEGRKQPLGPERRQPGRPGARRQTGKSDAKCESISDPYQKFKCQLMISAKNPEYAFHNLVPQTRPWDNQTWTDEEIKDLEKAYKTARWQHSTGNDLRTGERLNRDSELSKVAYPRPRSNDVLPTFGVGKKAKPYNPAEELLLKLRQQEDERQLNRRK